MKKSLLILGVTAILMAILFITGCQQQEEIKSNLPKDDPKFEGKIGNTADESVADFPLPLTAPKGSPNVLIILLDDVGF